MARKGPRASSVAYDAWVERTKLASPTIPGARPTSAARDERRPRRLIFSEEEGVADETGECCEEHGGRHGHEENECDPFGQLGAEATERACVEESREPRQERGGERPRTDRDGKVVEVERESESDDTAGNPVRNDDCCEDAHRVQARIAKRRDAATRDLAHLGVAPAGSGNEHDAGARGAEPLGARMERHGEGRPEAEQEELAEPTDSSDESVPKTNA